MRRLLQAAKRKDGRELILVLLAVAGSVATGLWTIFVYFAPAPEKMEQRPQTPTGVVTKGLEVEKTDEIRSVVANGGIAIGGSAENSQLTVSPPPAEDPRR